MLVRAPWLLVGGPGTHLLSLILLVIAVMCVITEKKTATKHRQAMLSKLFVVSGILIGGGPAPPLWLRLCC